MQLRIMYRMLRKALNFDFQVINMHKKQQPKDRNRAFHKSPLSCLLITTLIFSYVSSTIIVHHPQAMAKILDGSARVSTGSTISGNITSFHKSYEILINDSHLLTQTYQNEIRKWQLKQYNNSTII